MAAQKILIIRFSSIGDIVLMSPVFRCVKKQQPETEIHFLTKRAYSIVTEANPYIEKFHYYENNMDELLLQLKEEKFDHVFDLHNNIRSNKIKRALKSKVHTIKKLNVQKFLLTQLNIDVMPNRHITLRSLDPFSAINVKDDGGGLDYFIAKKDEINDNDLPGAHAAGFIAIVIGATYFTKRMPVDKLIELCNKLNHPIVLLGGEEDKAKGDVIAAQDDIKIYNACGKFNISESAAIINKSKLVVSNDTGLQYIACAFQKPVIAIWGGTTPDLDVEPYYGSFIMNRRTLPMHENILTGIRCQPCSKYGLDQCPLGHFNCMEKHDVNRIANTVKQFLQTHL